MSVRIAGARTWVTGGSDGLLADLLSGRRRTETLAPDPERPAGVPSPSWRRMSRLARAACAVAAPLVVERADRERLAVVWGSAFGELVPTSRFLERLFTEGPELASPLSFQNSVYNAPAGHLSISFGLRGPAETVAAGAATGLTALLRGVDLLRLGQAETVLVVAGDDRSATLERSFALRGEACPMGEAVAAVLLTREGAGPRIELTIGVAPGDGPTFARAAGFPDERSPLAVPGALAPEEVLGWSSCLGLAVVAALAGGIDEGRLSAASVVDQDDRRALTARLSA